MKKALIFVSYVLLVFASCKKNSDVTPANTISADIDGVNESFNSNTFAQLGSGVNVNSTLYILGSNGNTANSDQITITMMTNKTLTTGNYVSGNDNVGFVSVTYEKGPISLSNPNVFATDVTTSSTTVVITLLTSTNVQGTFSGKLVYGSETKTVTNGKFNLPLK